MLQFLKKVMHCKLLSFKYPKNTALIECKGISVPPSLNIRLLREARVQAPLHPNGRQQKQRCRRKFLKLLLKSGKISLNLKFNYQRATAIIHNQKNEVITHKKINQRDTHTSIFYKILYILYIYCFSEVKFKWETRRRPNF